MKRVVQLTDWLPPEFSAVSQFALLIAKEEAQKGTHVTVVGLNSTAQLPEQRNCGSGTVHTVCVQRVTLNRQTWTKRLIWTVATNFLLIWKAWPYLRSADIVRFTGAPPFLIYWLVPLNLILRKQLVYRITDFYPECIAAALKRKNHVLGCIQRITNFLRRRVEAFEVLGEDMRERLLGCGVRADRITLRRDGSPVPIDAGTPPAPRPAEFRDRALLLYSGNWGAAHDIDTFFDGYRRHHEEGNGSVVLWLNATGSGADAIDARLRAAGLPFVRQKLVPLDELPHLLMAADAHLITLRPEFMGFVLPSKIYGCIATRRPILYVGPAGSDVHRLCEADAPLPYRRVEVGDAQSVGTALDALGKGSAVFSRTMCIVKDAESVSLSPEPPVLSQARMLTAP